MPDKISKQITAAKPVNIAKNSASDEKKGTYFPSVNLDEEIKVFMSVQRKTRAFCRNFTDL